MICSSLIAVALKGNGLGVLLAGTAIVGGILVLGLLFVSFGGQKHEKDASPAEAGFPAIGLGVTIAMAAMFFIYVAMENGIGIWSAEYAKRLANGISGMTTRAPMFFYAGLTSGRAYAPLVLRRLSGRKIVLGALGLAAAATALQIASRSLPGATVAVFLAGLGLASISPTYFDLFLEWYGPGAEPTAGIPFAFW